MRKRVYAGLAAALLAFFLACPLVVQAAEADNAPTTALAVNALPLESREEYAGRFWRLDAAADGSLPENFRQSTDAVGTVDGIQPETAGLAELHSSGSAQMSQAGMEGLMAELRQASSGPIYIVDLRQETHGYMDGIAVSFYGKRNWGNIGKKTADILTGEKDALEHCVGENVDIYRLDSHKEPVEPAEISLQPEVTATEAEIAAAAGAQYFRITSTDHIWTDPESVDRFIAFYKTLPKDAWLHFHCEAGKGRTTTYMVLYDILRNGMQVPLADIAAREYKIGGEDLLRVNSANAAKKKAASWKTPFEAERAGMIKLFYQYVRENPDLKLSWSEWLQQHH